MADQFFSRFELQKTLLQEDEGMLQASVQVHEVGPHAKLIKTHAITREERHYSFACEVHVKQDIGG